MSKVRSNGRDHAAEGGMERERLASLREACSRLGLSQATLYRMKGRGELQMVPIGRRTFIRESELLRLMRVTSAGS